MSRTRKKIEKQVRALHPLTLFLACLFLAGGIAAGFFGVRYLRRDDICTLEGVQLRELTVGEPLTYTEEGLRVVAFGKDISDRVTVETNMQQNADGTYTGDTSEPSGYYILYRIDHFLYKDVVLVRNFRVSAAQEEN